MSIGTDNTEHMAVLEEINKALKALDAPTIDCDGIHDDLNIGIEIEEVFDKIGYHPTGKYRVAIGRGHACYLADVRPVIFPQLKKGGYSYNRIAAKIVEMATFVKAHKAAKDASKAVYEENQAFLNALTEELNIFSTSVSCSRQTGSMSFSAYNLTQNQAEQLIRFADSIGILMKRS